MAKCGSNWDASRLNCAFSLTTHASTTTTITTITTYPQSVKAPPTTTMMSEPMGMDINSDMLQDRPLRSEPETPRADYDDPPIRRRRALDDQIEKVTDETGEMVRGAFLLFLETYYP